MAQRAREAAPVQGASDSRGLRHQVRADFRSHKPPAIAWNTPIVERSGPAEFAHRTRQRPFRVRRARQSRSRIRGSRGSCGSRSRGSYTRGHSSPGFERRIRVDHPIGGVGHFSLRVALVWIVREDAFGSCGEAWFRKTPTRRDVSPRRIWRCRDSNPCSEL